MHPANSVIIFSCFSGAGFGLLAFLGFGFLDVYGLHAFIFYFLAFALAVGGLLASTFHLGNKKNAIKSFREWRTSWLSREAIASVLALILCAFEASARIFFHQSFPIIGWLGGLMALFTVFTTAMIYTQLKTVPRWNSPITPPLFLGFAITSGSFLIALTGVKNGTMICLIILAILQIIHWMNGDGAFDKRGHNMESATALGAYGKIRQFEPPHSGSNYLLHEMAYQIGRKHAMKLRGITLVLTFLLPLLILFFMGSASWAIGVAFILFIGGTVVSRWLFFAEARHVMALYYDR